MNSKSWLFYQICTLHDIVHFVDCIRQLSYSLAVLRSVAVAIAVDVHSSAPSVVGGSVSTTQQPTLPYVPASAQLQLDVATTSVVPVSSSRAADCETADTGPSPAMSEAIPVDCTSVTQANIRVGMFYGSRCRRSVVKPLKYC